MLQETKTKGIALLAAKNAVDALIETQTILQLLVKKGIVTREEVSLTRNVVKNRPKYKQVLDALKQSMDQVNENAKFEDLMKKSLQPDGRENLTKEEKDYLQNTLDSYIKNSAKTAREMYGDKFL